MATDRATDRRLLDAIADDMLDRLVRTPEISEVRHHVQVTSFGGSGTTTLCDSFLDAGVDVPATPGSFPFKHQRVPPPPDAVPAGFRVVFPFGDPRNAVLSVFRRGFQGGHYRSMHLRRPAPDAEARLTDLDQFLEGGIDLFEMEDQFDRWYRAGARTYPVLFLRFADLPGSWTTVSEFVGLPAGTPAPAVHARASEWQALPAAQSKRINEMYGAFARRLESLAATELR